MSLAGFHPVIQRWFASRFAAPTEPQARGWPEIAAGRHTLIAAPTGSGKTLTAFLAVIDRLFREAAEGRLADGMRVVYVSPLRALSNDMHRNLETPLAEIMAEMRSAECGVRNVDTGSEPKESINHQPSTINPSDHQPTRHHSPLTTHHSPPSLIRVGLRTGDTPSHKRAQLVKHPPHIFVTTPESLYLMLTAERSREVLRTVDTIIVDEIHALVRDKRGSHLALSLERLAALTDRPLQRIGLSATQKPLERMAEFLVGGDRHFGFSILDFGLEGRGDAAQIENRKSKIQNPPVSLIDVGHQRALDLAIETPPSDLGAVCTHEQWEEVNARIVELINAHRSTLIFVNTRRLAERLTHQLTQLLGEEHVSSHHGSLAADIRLDTEQRLKNGQLKAVVATASLELGIDVGHIDLVIQIGSPRSIATFLQRIGRSGHALGLVPKGRLFALTRDELLECMALMRAIDAGRLDATPIPAAPLDVLAQQIVAEVAAQEWSTDELFALCRRAYPYRNLSRADFDAVLHFLSEGITDTAGRSRTFLHHDQVNRRVRARKNARLAAINNGGAIPEVDSIRVVLDDEHTVVGSVDEDFGVESMAGDIFLLGNNSWRIRMLRGNDLVVTDAHGAPPTIPFWRGEAPGRTIELSEEVSRLREDIEQRITDSGFSILDFGLETQERAQIQNPKSKIQNNLIRWLAHETHASEHAAGQVLTYIAAQHAAIGLVPTQSRVVFERFFDESGGMQLVVHAPFGGRINRAWGLAMRKRFCRSFDFELQASADDDGFILSLGPQHSFPIESLFPMLRTDNVRNLLEQALLAVPMFHVRWRWNATRALIVARQRNGKKVPPALQRFRSEDLLTAVFPKLTGCQENITGDHEIPDHPLVRQTMHDCLHEALDLDGLADILARVERGEIAFVARDTREPSPFAYEVLNANPYAFLDGGEIQERRARAVSTRRSLSVDSVRDLGRLDPAAIEQVVAEAQPLVRNADELHDVLLSRILLPVDSEPSSSDEEMRGSGDEATAKIAAVSHPSPHPFIPSSPHPPEYLEYFHELTRAGRAATVTYGTGRTAWVAAERWPAVPVMFPDAACDPPLSVPSGVRTDWIDTEARVATIRGLLEVCGPITHDEVAHRLGFTPSQSAAALEALEGEGAVLRGQFKDFGFSILDFGLEANSQNESKIQNPKSKIPPPPEWCHRRLLARIHRLTIAGLRREIEPVDVPTFVRFLAHHHGVLPATRRNGANGVFEAIAQLQGFEVPAAAWERDVLASRVRAYRSQWLDELCLAGEVGWGRLYPPPRDPEAARPMASITRVAPVSLFLREDLPWLVKVDSPPDDTALSSPARDALDLFRHRGALFAADLMDALQLLPAQVDDVLGELVTRGFVTSDGFAGLRSLVRTPSADETVPHERRGPKVIRRRRSTAGAGRWSEFRPFSRDPEQKPVVSPAPPRSRAPAPSQSLPDSPSSASRAREATEHWAWQLLRRWGVMFRDLLQCETAAPAWFELAQVYRRLEARGEIRGGRFIKGVAGEQFALPDTIRELRRARDMAESHELVVLSAADPLNLTGVLCDAPRVPGLATNRVAWLGGEPVAALQSGSVTWLADVPAALRAEVEHRLGLFAPSAAQATAMQADRDSPHESRAPDGPRRSRARQRSPSGIPRPRIS
jgi:ATP-dependent Lhr-like helicase